MSVAPSAYRWSTAEFIRAWEAGVFNHRVELVNGEVWPVVIGLWHGRVQVKLTQLLPSDGAEILTATLPLEGAGHASRPRLLASARRGGTGCRHQ